MSRTASVTIRPKPPVAKMTRARVRPAAPRFRGASEVVAEGVERQDQRPRRPVGPEPGVDRVERADLGRAPQRLEHTADHLGDELLVRDRLRTAVGLAVGFVEEDQVEVAVIVQLAAAELAQGEDRPAVALAVAGPPWGAEPRGPAVPLVARHLGDDRLGDVGQLAGHLADRLAAEDVAGADPDPFLVAEAERIGARSSAPWHSSASSALIAEAGQRAVDDQRIHQVVDHARVVDQDLGEELAGRAQLDVEPQARRIEVEQLPEDRLGAQRRRDLLEVRQRHVGVGRPADRLEQPRRDRGQEVAAARLREEREILAGQGHQVLVGRRAVAERVAAEHLGDMLGGGVGVEHQVDDRVGGGAGRRRGRRRGAGG